jgi:hypothetical protein
MNSPDEFVTCHARGQLTAGCETMKRLLTGLLDTKGKVAEEVHSIRKLGKSLRGGFSLFRLEKTASTEIQAIGRLLSGPRDAVSRFNTWNKLAWSADPLVSEAIGQLLEQQTHSAARRPPQGTIDWCLARVDAALAALGELTEENLDHVLAQGIAKLERRAIKRCRKLRNRREEDCHEARKALKALLGAAGFLPENGSSLDPRFHDLAERLGDENDLSTLSLWLSDHGFTERFAPDLWKTVATERRTLQRKAIADVKRLSSTESG